MMTEPFPGYNTLSLVISVAASVLLFIYLVRATFTYHQEGGNERLLLALVLFVAAVGTAISGVGLIVDLGTINGWRIYGLSITRGALLVGGVVALLMELLDSGEDDH